MGQIKGINCRLVHHVLSAQCQHGLEHLLRGALQQEANGEGKRVPYPYGGSLPYACAIPKGDSPDFRIMATRLRSGGLEIHTKAVAEDT
eukprot:12926428-Ditylum_brightwellii.AAC.1